MKKMFLIIFVLLTAGFAQAAVENGKASSNFTLTDTHGKIHRLTDYKGKFVVLEWFNPDCPFIKKHYNSGNMQKLQKKYVKQGVIWLSIDSSAKGKEGAYSPAKINQWAKKHKDGSTALFLDSKGKVARLYGAKTTPHMFIINPQGILIYQGAIDSIASTDPADIAQAKNYVQAALYEAVAKKTVSTPVTKSYGCSVKY